MNILMATLGTAGDVYPFAAVGSALRGRGHAVTLVTHGRFEEAVRGEGMEFIELGDRESYRAMMEDPAAQVPGKAAGLLIRKLVLPAMEELYGIIERLDGRETVVVASALALGARVAHEKLEVPLATVHLQPAAFRSFEDPPVHPAWNLPPWVPRTVRRVIWSAVNLAWSGLAGGEINRFRSSLGLPGTKHVFSRWVNSPVRVIGLFPEWFARPAPDWPGQTELTGFALFDRDSGGALPGNVEALLGGGDPPAAITPGTGNLHARAFCEAALEGCRRAGKKVLLITPHRQNLPDVLPAGAVHAARVPFSRVLPRCACLVHHGGIGTMAQAMAAGIPQLVVPFVFDQADNAARLQKLGAGRWLTPKKTSAANMAKGLAALLGSPQVRERCRDLAARTDSAGALDRTCLLIEELAP